MRLQLPFHSYQHRARQVASRRLVNCFAEQVPIPGKGPVALLRSPGIALWYPNQSLGFPGYRIRGIGVHDGQLYISWGPGFYRISEDGITSTFMGYIDSTAERVSMVSNGSQFIIVSEPHGYVYTTTGGLVQITDADFTGRGASSVCVIDGFALFTEPNTARFFCSDYLDATSFDPLGFATAEGLVDGVLRIVADHRQALVFGAQSLEIWFNAGSPGPIPFQREQNGLIETGCIAAESIAKVDNTVFWLDEARVARRLVDMTAARISTHALEQAWNDYERVDDAFAVAYQHEGHWFYNLTFPTARTTFVYDAATGEWHERSSKYETEWAHAYGNFGAWRARQVVNCYGKTLVADVENLQIGEISSTCYTEWDNTLLMEWTYPNVYGEGKRAFHRRLEIDVEAGVGWGSVPAVVRTDFETGYDPQIMLAVSDDGSDFKVLPNRYIGKVGERRKRITWHRLGCSYDRVYRASVSAPVPVTVWDSNLVVDGGRL